VAEAADIAGDIRALIDAAEEDPERLEAIAARRQLLRDIMRKYGSNLTEVIAFGRESSRRLAELEGYEERVRELQQEREVAMSDLKRAADRVAAARRKHAPLLAREVENRIRFLAMDHAAVVIDVVASGDEIDAGDNVMFLLAANPGSPPLPLSKVASGGELARTMLSLRLVLTEEPGTMVFDEVDAGIGGEAAIAVAKALSELGGRHQIFVVTHLPQVAAAARHHIGVSKKVEAGSTFGSAALLDESERVVEVARMLSGGLADETARQHAGEMIRTFSSSERT
jgi:DNA repair protein RecN (Recombination protein N)